MGELRKPVIEELNAQHNLVQLVLEDLARYKTQAQQQYHATPMEERARFDQVHTSRYFPHSSQVDERLTTLNYIITHSTLLLSQEQVDSLWASIIINALTLEEREQGYRWFTQIELESVASWCTVVFSRLFLFVWVGGHSPPWHRYCRPSRCP